MSTEFATGERTPLVSDHSGQENGYAGLPIANGDKRPQSLLQRTRSRLTQDIDTKLTDLILISCFFLSGMIDAGAYNAYECFVSMMTGNTVFLALGISDLPVSEPRLSWTKSLCSIVAFFLGTLSFSAFHQRFGARKRWTLILSFVIQGALVFIAATLTRLRHVSESPGKRPSIMATIPADPGFPWMNLVPIALLSFQASGKILTSRLLGYPHLATVILTVLYTDLLSDPTLFTAGIFGNGMRNQRLGGATFYFGGAVVGGVLASSILGFEGALWIAGISNMVIVMCWTLWKSDEGDK